jgi:hypothetical protein
MAALADYLHKLIEKMKLLRPDNAWRYTLPGYGEILAYCDHDYDLQRTARPDSLDLRLSFNCTVAQDQCAVAQVEGATIKALAGAFGRVHLHAQMLDTQKDGNGEIVAAKLRARGRIALLATFAADADGTAVRMSFDNFDTFGSALKSVPIGQLDDALFDELGRYLMREPNALFREALPEDYRAQLRSAVERSQIKKRWEFKIAARRKSELEAIKRQHGSGESLLGRLRSLVRKEK